jgi:hypothetical protein
VAQEISRAGVPLFVPLAREAVHDVDEDEAAEQLIARAQATQRKYAGTRAGAGRCARAPPAPPGSPAVDAQCDGRRDVAGGRAYAAGGRETYANGAGATASLANGTGAYANGAGAAPAHRAAIYSGRLSAGSPSPQKVASPRPAWDNSLPGEPRSEEDEDSRDTWLARDNGGRAALHAALVEKAHEAVPPREVAAVCRARLNHHGVLPVLTTLAR